MSRPSLISTLRLLSAPLAPLPKSFWLWRAHAPSLWTETKPGICSGMPHAILVESCLIMASHNCFSFLFFLRQQPESGGFMLLKMFQYQSMGAT
jgi:hypothetical protein